MVDQLSFPERLDAALAMNDLENADFAAAFGPSGQQLVNRWRSRGRIGAKSVAKAIVLLPRTSMDWLQEGMGDPERFSEGDTTHAYRDKSPSYAMRPNMHTLAAAVKVMTADESHNGGYGFMRYASALVAYYHRIEAGERADDIINQVLGQERSSNVENSRNGNGTIS